MFVKQIFTIKAFLTLLNLNDLSFSSPWCVLLCGFYAIEYIVFKFTGLFRTPMLVDLTVNLILMFFNTFLGFHVFTTETTQPWRTNTMTCQMVIHI